MAFPRPDLFQDLLFAPSRFVFQKILRQINRFFQPDAAMAECSPLTERAASLPPEARQHFEDNFLDYMGMLRVRVTWQRGGAEFEARGETLLRPDLIWLPEGEL